MNSSNNFVSLIDWEKTNEIYRYVKTSIPYYKEAFSHYPDRLETYDDLRALPVLSKHNLQFVHTKTGAKPDAIHVWWTGGTSGLSTPIEWYSHDFNQMIPVLDNVVHQLNLSQNDIVLSTISNPMGPLGIFLDRFSQRNNLTSISLASSAKPTLKIIENIFQLYPIQMLFCTPQGAIRICNKLMESNIQTSIKAVITTGAPLSMRIKNKIENILSTNVFNLYGCTEAGSLGVSCLDDINFHIDPRFSIVEIINPDSDGIGEVLITSLINKRSPVFRYHINDIGRLENYMCTCGSNWSKLSLIRRSSETIYIGGTKIDAEQIEYVLDKLDCLSPYQFVYYNTEDNIPELELRVLAEEIKFSTADFLDYIFNINPNIYNKITSGNILFKLKTVSEHEFIHKKGDKYCRITQGNRNSGTR